MPLFLRGGPHASLRSKSIRKREDEDALARNVTHVVYVPPMRHTIDMLMNEHFASLRPWRLDAGGDY